MASSGQQCSWEQNCLARAAGRLLRIGPSSLSEAASLDSAWDRNWKSKPPVTQVTLHTLLCAGLGMQLGMGLFPWPWSFSGAEH